MSIDSFEMAKQLHELYPGLAAEIAKCCEQAYRRGYQQGAAFGQGLGKEIFEWRFGLDPAAPEQADLTAHYSMAPVPPSTEAARPLPAEFCSSLARLSMEASNASTLIWDLVGQSPASP